MADLGLRARPARRSAACAATGSSWPRPQGSTGYNLANGGPVLAWGVEGYVVSFIAPHSLTARALVVAPADELTINNASREEPVEIHVDGRPTVELPPGEDITRVRPRARRRWPSCRARRSTTGCARSSAAWRDAVVASCSDVQPRCDDLHRLHEMHVPERRSVGRRW